MLSNFFFGFIIILTKLCMLKIYKVCTNFWRTKNCFYTFAYFDFSKIEQYRFSIHGVIYVQTQCEADKRFSNENRWNYLEKFEIWNHFVVEILTFLHPTLFALKSIEIFDNLNWMLYSPFQCYSKHCSSAVQYRGANESYKSILYDLKKCK